MGFGKWMRKCWYWSRCGCGHWNGCSYWSGCGVWLLDALDAAAGANAVNAASGCDGCGYWNTCGMRLLDAVEAAIGGNVVMLLFFAGSTGWLGFAA